MAERAEDILNKGCNLIKKGTHEVFIRLEDGAVFVIDTDLNFDFAVSNSLTLAKDTAIESNNAPDGCAGCRLYPQCIPTPTVISDVETEKLIPAQKTSFE